MTNAIAVFPYRSKESEMLLIHEELARGHQAQRRREAELAGRAVRVAAAKRWRRRAEEAGRRARLAAAAVR